MAMPGTGCFIATHNILPGREADYEHWHTHEHMIERLAIPGFLRGMRYRSAAQSSPQVCTIYQVDSLSTLTSPAYLERLNNPTPWTIESVPLGVGMTKTFCNVAASFGHGIGSYLGMVQLAPGTNHEKQTQQWLREDVLPSLARQPGLCGAHLLIGDPEASRTKAKERELRSESAAVADWIVLIEGYDKKVTEGSVRQLCAPVSQLAQMSGTHPDSGLLFCLDFSLDESEAKPLA